MADELVELIVALIGLAATAAVGFLRWAAVHPRVTAVLAAGWALVEVTR